MNKKILLGLLALAATYHGGVLAQTARPNTLQRLNKASMSQPSIDNQVPVRVASPGAPVARPRVATVPYGTQIGITWYDLMSNASSYNRVKHDNNGNTVSANWTQSCTDGGTAFANRGTGYNYFNGSNWVYAGPTGICATPQAQYGINTRRVGFPEMLLVDEAGGGKKEVSIAHTGAGMSVISRPKGNGAWTATANLPFTTAINGVATATATWPRAAASGQTIHLIYASGEQTAADPVSKIISPMFYSRSVDGGATWDVQNRPLPGLDTLSFARIGGDNYNIDANGQYVSIVVGTFGESVKVLMSANNGTDWTVKELQKNEPRLQPTDLVVTQNARQDTISVRSDGIQDITVDATGKTTVVTGLVGYIARDTLAGAPVGISLFVSADTTGRTGNGYQFPTVGGQGHYELGLGAWQGSAANPGTGGLAVIAGLDPYYDANYSLFNFVAQPGGAAPNDANPYRNPTGYQSMATSSVDAAGNVYVIYAGVVKGATNDGETGQPFRDLYYLKINVDGSISDRYNIGRELRAVADGGPALSLIESVYPSADPRIGADNLMHYTFMSDDNPGNNLNTVSTDPATENAIIYDAINVLRPLAPSPTGIRPDAAAVVASLNAVPNPTTGLTTLHVELKKAATASVVIRNVLGREVGRVPATALNQGSNAVQVNLSNLASGVYFYTVSGDNFSLTQRVVKN